VDKFWQALYGAAKSLILNTVPCIAHFLSTAGTSCQGLSRFALDNPVHNPAIALYGARKLLILNEHARIA
jgi:hypothetical protein